MTMKFTVLFLAVLCGCSTTATISRTNGVQLDAEIQRSDRDHIFIMTDAGSEVSIPRSSISDIDHPGNVVGLLGGLLSGYGAVNIAAGAETCGKLGGAYCVGTFLPAAIGLPMLIWGMTTWHRSTEAANNFTYRTSKAVPPAPPPAAFDVSSSRPAVKARAPREQLQNEGFQNTRWGMTPEQVQDLYFDAKASSPDILSLNRLLVGYPAAIHFGFVSGQLTQVQAELTHSEKDGQPPDVFGHIKELLGQKYGPPSAQGEGSVTWRVGGTSIELVKPGQEGTPVKLVYLSVNSTKSVPGQP